MHIIRFAIGTTAITAWMAFAFSPRAGEGKRVTTDLDVSSVEATLVRGRPLSAPSELAIPTRMQRVGRYLVVVDRFSEPKIHLIDPATGEALASVGQDGEGPGELRVPFSVKPDANGTGFWVLDVKLARLTHYLIEAGQAPDLVLDRSIRIETPSALTDFTLLSDGGLLASGFFQDGRFAEFALDGTYQGPRGSLPIAEPSIPPSVLLHAWQGRMRDVGGGRIAIAARYAGMLEIFDAAGRLEREIRGPFEFLPAFSVGEGERGPAMATGDDLRFGYVDLAVTDRYVFGLFSGRTRGRAEADASLGRYVHVFTWDGQLVNILELDADAMAIEVDAAGSELFAIRRDPVPSIWVYPVALGGAG